MELVKRLEIYKKIEDYRKRPLIVYATSTRENVPAFMASDSVRQLIDQLDAIRESDSVDVLIHSSGGDALAAWKLMSVLRERFKHVYVLVPFMAFSAATIFALGADEIVMHPHASLGPIDPQITVPTPNGPRGFSYEDLGAFLRFISEEVGISEQAYTVALVDKIFSAVDPLQVGAAKRASELSTSVGERLLKMHLKESGGKDTARQIAENLNKSFFAHGDAVSRTRARELNLNISKDDEILEKLMWEAYLGIESYMQLKEPFNPLHQFLADPAGKASLEPLAPLVMPVNTPQPLIDQMWSSLAQQAISKANGTAVQIDFLLIHAIIDSVRTASEYYSEGKISANRTISSEVQISMLTTKGGWRCCPPTTVVPEVKAK